MDFIMISIFILLMVEMLICTVAMLPISMATRKSLFTGLNKVFGGKTPVIVFRVIFVILLGIFGDAIINSSKYDRKIHDPEGATTQSEKNNLYLMLFRYQRNIYLTGFTLYLFFLIYRAQSIVLELTSVETKSNAVIKQAENNKSQTERLIKSNSELEEEVKTLRKKEKEFIAMKSQAENTSKEYLKLKKEYDALLGTKTKGQKKDD
ncbi:BCAP29/BCAP31 family protein [Heterostelium album PN500]|uniref:Endoplasmic reticulum transmembrane protein n=1 Tax=Heterostelium pallidum (strain ATCC 26659 / Pp 5 / PN500) TaxID=670386 RepID=D3B6G0_HETP5|nr:BCAP29/BCAP31 family protein [Heterostelium album PN500]EFA82930.1 BCAP29/BCAP31 family protein [Heterostelium album PN500]|eukprot:XP_020435047.1 BCAP29/BCAP31 family protein [Heterostelium album PN500]